MVPQQVPRLVESGDVGVYKLVAEEDGGGCRTVVVVIVVVIIFLTHR